MELVILSVSFVFVLAWPVLKEPLTPIRDKLYLLRQEYQSMKGKRKAWRLLVGRVEPWLGKGIVDRTDRLLRLAGRPWQMRGSELIVLEGVIVILVSVLMVFLPNGRVPLSLIMILLMVIPLNKLRTKVMERRIDAAVAMRVLKQRFNTQLKMNIPLTDALQEIADYAPGEFGETFRKLMEQKGIRSIRDIMRELRTEFEVRELDSFCLAIEMADEKSIQGLTDSLDRQIKEEADREEEFIEEQIELVKPKLLGLVALSLIYSLVFAGYFAYVEMLDRYSTGRFFIGF